jgi:hypothetical protein
VWRSQTSGYGDSFLLFVILATTALAYLPTLTFPFAADDASQILNNVHVHDWRYIPEYFTSHVWAHISLASGQQGAAYYRPIFLLWELAVWTIFGPSALGWHLSAIATHLCATAIVYFVARRLVENRFTAYTAALIFGVYPIHVEGVAWISGVTEPLAAVPFLASMLCWLRARESQDSLAWRRGSVVLYSIALLAKETTVVLPAVLLVYELLVQRRPAKLFRHLIPFAVVTLVYFVVRQVALSDTSHTPLTWTVLLLTWPSVLWFYLRHALFPFDLSFLYDMPLLSSFTWTNVGLPAVCVALSALLIHWLVRGRPLASFAAVFSVLTLLPPLYLRAFKPVEIVHDRYLYLPSVGVCLLLALAISSMPERVQPIGAFALAVGLAAATVIGCQPWSNEVALLSRAVQQSPGNWHAQRQLAFALGRSGQCEEAMPRLAALIDGTPDDYVAIFSLGACNFHLGHFSEAARLMSQTLKLAPAFQQAYLLLATIRVGEGQINEAEDLWRQSQVVESGGQPELTFHLVHAEILKARGDLRGAISEYRKELELQPGNEEITAALMRAQRAPANLP